MPSIVLELQAEALDSKGSVADLLRKALVVAVKLNLTKFREWIELELKGYLNKKVPAYRVVGGKVVVFNPYHGYQPVFFADLGTHRLLSTYPINTPIGLLQETIDKQANGCFYLNFPPDVKHNLLQMLEFPLEPSYQIPRAAIALILNTVRDTILQWTLDLEGDGILGEGLSFSTQEKKIAAEKATELEQRINIVIAETITNSALQQGSPCAAQTAELKDKANQA